MALTLGTTSTAPTRDASAMAAPASLPVNVIAANEARRRAALSSYQEATAGGAAAQGRIEADRITASRDLAAALENARFQGMSSLASIGQARSPRFADRFRRQLTRQELRQRGELERQTAMQLSSVEEMMASARRARDRELLGLEADEVLQRTALDRIFTPPTFRSAQ
jgi:hypothetical protein